jgi:hypothetical protein
MIYIFFFLGRFFTLAAQRMRSPFSCALQLRTPKGSANLLLCYAASVLGADTFAITAGSALLGGCCAAAIFFSQKPLN